MVQVVRVANAGRGCWPGGSEEELLWLLVSAAGAVVGGSDASDKVEDWSLTGVVSLGVLSGRSEGHVTKEGGRGRQGVNGTGKL